MMILAKDDVLSLHLHLRRIAVFPRSQPETQRQYREVCSNDLLLYSLGTGWTNSLARRSWALALRSTSANDVLVLAIRWIHVV
jgi:hypothetical protein